jgi:hypothetical protein
MKPLIISETIRAGWNLLKNLCKKFHKKSKEKDPIKFGLEIKIPKGPNLIHFILKRDYCRICSKLDW